jgi:renalase
VVLIEALNLYSIIVIGDLKLCKRNIMQIIIVGAGISGLAAAYHLNQHAPSLRIHCIEKSRGIGGRVATRRRDGAIFDHGAQFFRPVDDAQHHFFTQVLPHDQLIDIAPPVWTFDKHNTITQGDTTQNTLPKFIYRDGINQLAKLLTPTHMTITRETRVHHILLHDQQVTCVSDTGAHIASGAAVVFTPPAPQTHEILAASTLPPEMHTTLCTALAQAQYRPCLSVTLAFHGNFDWPYYALVNSDRAHDFSWVAFEHLKSPARVPTGQTLVTVQCGPAASRRWWEYDTAQLATTLFPQLCALLGTALPEPLWCDRQGWRYALPDHAADALALQTYEQSHGVYFTGDALIGLGRIQLAVAHGMATAQRLIDHLL